MTTLTRHFLDQRLQALRDDLVRMSSLFDTALQAALCALANQNIQLARAIVADDECINTLRYQIEGDCLAVIATQQPTAHDLRTIMAVFSMANELERMADHAAGIATLVIRLGDEPPLQPLGELPRMAEICRQMTRRAINAYLMNEAAQAEAVGDENLMIEHLFAQVFRELATRMFEFPRDVSRALPLLFVAHNLERIGDRAVNLAARAQFIRGNTLTASPDQLEEEASPLRAAGSMKFEPYFEAPLT